MPTGPTQGDGEAAVPARRAHDGLVPGGRALSESGAACTTEELLESGPVHPAWWRRCWTTLPPPVRASLGALAVLVLLGAGVVWWREQAAERELGQRVVLATPSIGVSISSTSPPGGSVHYFVVLGNDGPRPVWIDSLRAAGPELRLRLRGGDRRVLPGDEIAIPLSVRLTCDGSPRTATPGLDAEVVVRTQDGASVTRRTQLGAAGLLLDVADTICQVRTDLVNQELSGPVLGQG